MLKKSMHQTGSSWILPMAIVSIVFLALCSSVLSDAGLKQGVVLDALTGQPIESANIELYGEDGESVTTLISGIDGTFPISVVGREKVRFRVTHVGYRELQQTIILLDQAGPIQIRLSPTILQLHEVVVESVSRKPERVADAPASVTTLDAGQIASRPTLSPAGHLKGLPAVDAINTGINETRLVVRGFNKVLSEPDKLLVLMDGRNTRFPNQRYNLPRLLPTTDDDIERIEVVAGPGSALYGPNAANGVVHLITKSPFDSEGTVVNFGAGERETIFGSLRLARVRTGHRSSEESPCSGRKNSPSGSLVGGAPVTDIRKYLPG
jgi:outer membrane receptor for ferrienterochelin and colicins